MSVSEDSVTTEAPVMAHEIPLLPGAGLQHARVRNSWVPQLPQIPTAIYFNVTEHMGYNII